jgi:hypothetical protein
MGGQGLSQWQRRRGGGEWCFSLSLQLSVTGAQPEEDEKRKKRGGWLEDKQYGALSTSLLTELANLQLSVCMGGQGLSQ